MKRYFRQHLVLALALAALVPTLSFAQNKLVVAIQPTVASDEMLNKAKPLQQFLEKGFGRQNQSRDLRADAATPPWWNRFVSATRISLSCQRGRRSSRSGSAAPKSPWQRFGEVLHGKEKVEAPHYFSYWVVAPDSPYKDLHSLKGKSACFPSPISTSGFVAPMGRMIEMNLLQPGEGKEADPKAYFKEVLFGGGYGQCWQALKQGQVDTTVIAGDVPEKLYNEVLAGTRTVEQQGPIPSHAVVLSKELKDPLRTRAVQTIVKLGAPEHRELMRTFISSIFVGFKPTTASEHLGALQKYLKAANLKFTERL